MTIDRLALYQKSLLGGVGGLLGWALMNVIAPTAEGYASLAVVGACVGLALGAALGAYDGLFRDRNPRRLLVGAGFGAAIGLVGGPIGLVVGQVIYDLLGGGLATRAVGWALFGAAVGVTEGVARRQTRTALFGAYGGFLGGLFGGSAYEWLFGLFRSALSRESAIAVGSAVGLVLLGLFIGALIGLVENILRTAWLLFTSGRLEGQTRTLDPSKAETILGRSDLADICLLGDQRIGQRHARVVAAGGEFAIEAVDGQVLVGTGSAAAPVSRQVLQGGETIHLGGTRARFMTGKVTS